MTLNVAVGGTGTPIVLLHGFPQTHLMWRHVAADLVSDHTVICPDLRGYGDSDKPADDGHDLLETRPWQATSWPSPARSGTSGSRSPGTTAARWSRSAPGSTTRTGSPSWRSLDVLPTLDMWDVLRGTTAAVGFHLYLMAQPPGLPETMIGAVPDAFFGHFLDLWAQNPDAIPPDVRAAYLAASRDAVPSIVADYRASARSTSSTTGRTGGPGNQLRMPVTVLQQDWGAALGYDATALWQAWAPDLDHITVSCGHFMAEEAPAEVIKHLRDLLTR